MKHAFIIFLILLVFVAFGVGAAEGLSVVCTGFPCYDFSRAVLGDDAELTMLIRPGTEVHAYEPTPSDIIAIANSDLFVYIGGESDVWAEELLASLGDQAPAALKLFDCVDALEEEIKEGMTVHEGPEEEEEYDEHIWTSPVNAGAMVNSIKEALASADPERSAQYAFNADTYIEKIQRLDGQFRRIVNTAARKKIIFADRFPLLYFVREYRLDYQAAFPSCSSESEPSARTVAGLIDEVTREHIPVILILEMSSGRIAKTISEETGAKVMTFYSVQSISADDFANDETYVSLMERNVQTLKEALN